MSKHNYFVKIFKKIYLFINSLLEKYLNKLKLRNPKINKNVFKRSNRVYLVIVVLIILSFSYLLIPYTYSKSTLQIELKNQLLEKFNINFFISKNLNYNFFPRPHFVIEGASILENGVEMSSIEKLEVFISLQNIFSLKNITVRDIVLTNSNFYLNKNNYNFFINLLDNNFYDTSIKIINSNIFYRNIKQEMLFINKIKKIIYHYDSKNLLNTLEAENEIFNTPYSLEIQKDKLNKVFFSKLNSKILKLKIENRLNYKKTKTGLINIFYANNKYTNSYQLKKNSLNFPLTREKYSSDVFNNGLINYNPFFLNIDSKIDKLDIQSVFNSNSIFTGLLKTGIFNNKNLNLNININSNKITSYDGFKDSFLKFKIEEGLIDMDDSKISWFDFVYFQISNSLIYIDNNNLILDGKIIVDVKNSNKIHKLFQTPKKNRSEIKKLEFNFNYNLDQQSVKFDDFQINGQINKNIINLFQKSILIKDITQNQINFRNFMKKILVIYSG